MKNKSLLPLICLFLFSCTEEKQYQYEVNAVTTGLDNSNKTHRKSTTEFIAIAYSDLFGTNIPQSKLINLSVTYSSFGDLQVIEERIISNFLNDSTVVIPALPSVNGDTIQFIINSYKKFYNRNPTSVEKEFWKNTIRSDASATPLTIYFAMMTSDEYRFY